MLALDWDSRLVSTANAIISIWNYGKLQKHLDWHTSSFDAVVVPSCERDLAMAKIAGYLIFDGTVSFSIIIQMNQSVKKATPGGYDDPLVLIHHVLIIVAFGIGVYFRLATAYMAALLLNEASTPFVNVRALINATYPPSLRSKRPRGLELIYFANGVCLALSYFVFRLGWTAFVLAHAFRAWYDLWRVGIVLNGQYHLPVVSLLTMLLLGHFIINCLWFRHIANHLRRLLFNYPCREKKTSPASSNLALSPTPVLTVTRTSTDLNEKLVRRKKLLNNERIL